MRALYIVDNRNRYNWGCRATSAALSEMIRQEQEITGRISGRLTLSQKFVYTPLWDGKLNVLIYKNEKLYHVSKQIIGLLPYTISSKFVF